MSDTRCGRRDFIRRSAQAVGVLSLGQVCWLDSQLNGQPIGDVVSGDIPCKEIKYAAA
jgi:hypothetical protein